MVPLLEPRRCCMPQPIPRLDTEDSSISDVQPARELGSAKGCPPVPGVSPMPWVFVEEMAYQWAPGPAQDQG